MTEPTRRLGDSFAVALLQWPPLVAALYLPGDGWALAFKILCWTWVLIVGLSLVFGRGQAGPQWGLAMGFCALMVALACLLHPGAWIAAPLFGLFIGFHAALKVRLTEPETTPAPAENAVNAVTAGKTTH